MKRILYFIILISNFTYSQVKNRPDHEPPIVVNKYTEVVAFNICTNEITVADATFYGIGDTVLMIQMKGAVSIARVDVGYRTQLKGNTARMANSSFLLRVEYNFLNVFSKK